LKSGCFKGQAAGDAHRVEGTQSFKSLNDPSQKILIVYPHIIIDKQENLPLGLGGSQVSGSAGRSGADLDDQLPIPERLLSQLSPQTLNTTFPGRHYDGKKWDPSIHLFHENSSSLPLIRRHKNRNSASLR